MTTSSPEYSVFLSYEEREAIQEIASVGEALKGFRRGLCLVLTKDTVGTAYGIVEGAINQCYAEYPQYIDYLFDVYHKLEEAGDALGVKL